MNVNMRSSNRHNNASARIARFAFLCCALTIVGVVFAASNPPSPTPAKAARQPQAKASEEQAKAEPDKRATQEQPAVVELLKAPVIKVETTDKTEKHRDYTDHEWWLVYLTAALAATTLGLAIYTAKLYRSTKKIAGDAETAASNSVALTRATERAYIKMSHKLPGLRYSEGHSVTFGVEYRNWGRTPGTITGVSLAVRALSPELFPLPPAPEYETTPEHDIPQTFLVSNEPVFKSCTVKIGEDAVSAIQSRRATLLIVGYVDYRDQFGGKYRGGYARILNLMSETDNLEFFTQRGYNYDRPRQQGEGND